MDQEDIKYLDIEHIENICHKLSERLFDSNPKVDFKYVNKGIMESALGSTRQPYYETIFEKSGTLGFQIIKGHALLDGNKRIGMSATIVFLIVNGYILKIPSNELIDIPLMIANNEMNREEFARWLKENCDKLS